MLTTKEYIERATQSFLVHDPFKGCSHTATINLVNTLHWVVGKISDLVIVTTITIDHNERKLVLRDFP